MAPPVLTDVEFRPPGLGRLSHGLAHQAPLGFARRVLEVGAETAVARVVDSVRGTGRDPRRVLRLEPGDALQPEARSVALYVHYAASGAVSEMVRLQLALWREAGFAIVFVTTAPSVPDTDWRAARRHCSLVAHRANLGRDFGAWCDLAGAATARWPRAEELLLCNDSVLGPIRPLGPVLAALRAGGEGVFGLTESHQGGAHLQSYCVLARGRSAVADLAAFLAGLRLSASKWLVVQRGELGLARHMLARGHRVAALYGYAKLVDAALADPEQRDYLLALHPRLAARARTPDAMRAALLAAPLNPTHHLWMALVRGLGFPFLKTELVRRNPGRLPQVGRWRKLVGPDAPCDAGMIEAHLAGMDAAPGHG
jgi:hypothetical protein